MLKTIPEVKEFTEEIGKSGQWRGQALEGFVVRTHVSEPPSKPGKDASASPYAPGSSFFFKVKFDEPYMMYRDWREVTKILLSKGPSEEQRAEAIAAGRRGCTSAESLRRSSATGASLQTLRRARASLPRASGS